MSEVIENNEKEEKLPPVVYGDPVIDALNALLWGLPVPKYSDTIQRMQREVIELERKIEQERQNGQN
jgi:hypothetical protein